MMKAKVKDMSVDDLRNLISEIVRETFEDLMEDFLALSNKNYLDSVKEARKDYQAGRVKTIDDL